MSITQSERHFFRIQFDALTHILSTATGQNWPCTLFDISLHGALTSLPANWPGQCGDNYKLELQMGNKHEKALCMHMDVRVAHIENDHVGFEIKEMDVDTASHLHRLIELNAGDSIILDRDLTELLKLHKQ